MANSHIAHDVQLGDGCILANSCALAGHVNVEDRVIFGGLSAVHQFTRIGRSYAFIAGGAMVTMDVRRALRARRRATAAELAGLNTVGPDPTRLLRGPDPRRADKLTRTGSSSAPSWGLNEAIAKVKAEHGGHEEIDVLLDFVAEAQPGVDALKGAATPPMAERIGLIAGGGVLPRLFACAGGGQAAWARSGGGLPARRDGRGAGRGGSAGALGARGPARRHRAGAQGGCRGPRRDGGERGARPGDRVGAAGPGGAARGGAHLEAFRDEPPCG